MLGYDRFAGQQAETVLKYHALVAPSLEACLADAHTVMVMTQDVEAAAAADLDWMRGIGQSLVAIMCEPA